MFHSFRKYTVTLFLIAILWFLFGCDLGSTQKVIFKSPDGRIVVHEANSKPENIEEDGFTFLVDLNLPTYNLEEGGGYRVWIIPWQNNSPDYPENCTVSSWFYPSSILLGRNRNISRGGWLGYEDTNGDFIHVRRGTVQSWWIIVNTCDSSESENVFYFKDVFYYEVTEL